MTMSRRMYLGNVFHSAGSNRHAGTSAASLLLLLIVISVTAVDRYDQLPDLASVAVADAFKSNSLPFKEVSNGNDVSSGTLRTSSIVPAAPSVGDGGGSATPLRILARQQHRFGKPIAVTAAGKVDIPTKGSKKKRRPVEAAEMSSQQVPEMQVGCADGFIRSDHHHWRTGSGFEKKWEKKRSRSRRTKRDADPVEGERKRRDYPFSGYFSPPGYYQWTSKTIVQSPPHTPPQTAYSVWQPSLQQLARPYFIPMWGSAGRNPVYFPPQPLNAPYPVDNPRTSYLPPMPYLPPYPPREHTNGAGGGMMMTTTTLNPIWEGGDDGMDIMGGDGEDGEDGSVSLENIEGGGSRFEGNPVWDSSSGSSNIGNSINRIPTRRPKVPGTTTPVPSLLHGTSAITGNSGSTLSGNGFNSNIPPLSYSIISPMRPNQIGGSNRPNMQHPQQFDIQFTTRRPQPQRTTTTTTTTRRPATSNNDKNISRTPSRCVWAIVSCCTASSGQVNFGCFEELGCEGPFWDTNPCDSEVAKAAIANALKFYG